MIDVLVNDEVVNTVNNVRISTNMFRDNTEITSVNLKNYDWENNSAELAFANCSNLTSVSNVADSVDNIGSMFYNCESLTNSTFIIPNNVTNNTCSLSNEIFKCYSADTYYDVTYWDYELQEDVTESVQDFYVYKFYHDPEYNPDWYENRIGFYIDDKFHEINSQLMDYNDEYIYFEYYNQIEGNWDYIHAYRNSELDREDTEHFIKIGLYENCTNLTNANISSDNVTDLSYAFQNCNNLTNVNIICPSLNYVSGIFQNCNNLTNVMIESNEADLYSAFSRKNSIRNVTIKTNVSYLGSVFDYCDSLTDVNIVSNSVTQMQYTFRGCSNLVNAPVIPNSVTNMYETFTWCSNLVNVPEIPNSVTNMYGTFSECSKLRNVYPFPNNVINIAGVYSGCRNLVNIPEIPNSVTDMSRSFVACNFVNAPVIPNNVKNLSECFVVCNNLTIASEIPESVTNTSYMFDRCINLTGDITVHSSQILNSSYMFNGSSLEKNVYIPFDYIVNDNLYAWQGYWYYSGCPEILYTKTETPLPNTEGQLFYANDTEFTDNLIDNYDDPNYFTLKNGYGYTRNSELDIINGEHTLTYNSFINAGYSNKRGLNGVELRDINGAEIIFDVYPINEVSTYLNGELVENNVSVYGRMKYNEYILDYDNLYYVGHLRNLIKDETYIVTKDMTSINTHNIIFNTNVSNLEFIVKIGDKIINLNEIDTGIYSILLESDEELTISYLINGGSMYMDVEGTLTFNNQDITENITMIECDSEEWVQPILSSNGILGDDSFAVKSQSQANLWDVYKAFDGDEGTYWWHSSNEPLIIYNPERISITEINWIGDSFWNGLTIYGSNDNNNWNLINSTYDGNTTLILNNGQYYNYYKIEFSSEWFNIYEMNIKAYRKVPYVPGTSQQIDLTEYNFNIEDGTIKIGRYNGIDIDVTLPELIDEDEGE